MEALLSIVIAFTVGSVLTLGASLGGKQEELCAAMGGTYQPQRAPGDVCPDGKWSALVTGRK